jgi:DNA-binding transcriptional MerR regulator
VVLTIGEVSALTGIKPGRIRHYEARGLVRLDHRESGYRQFGPPEVLRLLQIDLLRSLGMGLEQIRRSLADDPRQLRQALERQASALRAERDRLHDLLAIVEAALSDVERDPDQVVARLAAAQRQSLGVFGRLERPLSPVAERTIARLLGPEWELPVPALFGQMVLPGAVTVLLERLAELPGTPRLFARLRSLARAVIALDSRSEAEALGRRWVAGELARKPDANIDAAFRDAAHSLGGSAFNQGFVVWAESISPEAGHALAAIQEEARRHGALVVGAVLVRPDAAARPPA